MYKLCIFDLDGTLVNSLRDLADAMNYALRQHGFASHETEKYRMMVGSGISVLADRAMGTPVPADDVKQAVLRDFSGYYNSHCLDATRPYDGIVEMLEKLTADGIRFAVNSNKPDAFSGYIVRSLFPDLPFAAVVGKRDDLERKPAPDGIFEILRQTGLRTSDCIYIGDSDVDVYTAKNAGVAFCGVKWGFRSSQELQQAGADRIAETPQALLSYITGS